MFEPGEFPFTGFAASEALLVFPPELQATAKNSIAMQNIFFMICFYNGK